MLAARLAPAERLRMQGVSPSAEGDRGALPLDPASAQVGAGPALDTLANFFNFVGYFSSVVLFSSVAYSARGKAVSEHFTIWADCVIILSELL